MAIQLTIGLLFWNLLVYMTYVSDKNKARRKQWRIPEKVLLLESLLLGGMGAMFAAYQWRHKTRKWYFVMTWYIGLIVDGLILYLIWSKK
ncbi:DUF1294 domain-containing protein [Streptococcus sp. SGI.013]|uniref:DUF1294 domain-containing protein n=1 Tax=unclassified Streptococcus TaxID=2608887 RepID=UPI003CFBC827